MISHNFWKIWILYLMKYCCRRTSSRSSKSSITFSALGSFFHGLQWLRDWMLQLCWSHWRRSEYSILLRWPPGWGQDFVQCSYRQAPPGFTIWKEQGICAEVVRVKWETLKEGKRLLYYMVVFLIFFILHHFHFGILWSITALLFINWNL